MRKSFVALLLVIGAASMANLAFAYTGEYGGEDISSKLMNAQMAKEMRSRAARLGPSSHDPALNDTTYVGFNPAYAASNYWSIGVGNRHPRGTFGPGKPDVVPVPDADRGYWDWETKPHGDSLQGWWPVRHLYTTTGGLTLADGLRPWWAVDLGNQVSYVINQGPGFRRTFGVTSAWHVDPGDGPQVLDALVPDANPTKPRWSALSGSQSAWCGLRGHGDGTVYDPITGNPYTVSALRAVVPGGSGATGTNNRFPGYASQWDQMLYRDIDISGAADDSVVKVSFRFRTRMSEGKGTTASTRTGWFDKDPLAVVAGNFISSTVAGASAPTDSFMVYVGCPVADTVGAEWLGSDGLTHTVFDPVRRWFGELIRANQLNGHYQLFTAYGNNPPIAVPADSNGFVDVSAARNVTYGQIKSTWGNKIRLVFRVKTNRGFDDENGSIAGQYSSMTRGAAQVDNVNIDLGAGPVLLGDFENQSDIDNDPACPATVAWKTSSKPPGIYHHVHELSSLIYQDICGPAGAIERICNLAGNVISMGDHDLSEAINGPFGTAEQEYHHGMVSPTINLVPGPGGSANNMGLNAADVVATEDFYVAYEIYTGVFDIFNSGAGWQFGFESYPAKASDGAREWGQFRLPPFQYFNPDKQCFDNLDGAYVWGLIRTSNPGAQPDSMRLTLRKLAQCFRFGITTGCGSTDGAYWDNVALAIVDGTLLPISVQIWEWLNDTFPANEDPGLPGLAAFDTTAALIKAGRNDAQTTNNQNRYSVPADSMLVQATGDSVAVQMVFRILPGPGNYVIPGDPSSGLRKEPTLAIAIDASDSSFWTSYILNPGKDSPGHPAGSHATRWSALTWNVAECDTAEQNLWPINARGINSAAFGGFFANIYRDDELSGKRSLLARFRNRCFLNDTLGAATDITCSAIPAWVGAGAGPPYKTGWDGSAQTAEGTKIIPDGLLTPGSHVQYFFIRKDLIAGTQQMCPDTNTVFPQNSESNFDAHRWQQFAVLPDAWKKSAYGGLGQACMLYVDWNDRRGNERVWVSVADSIGATSAAARGGHNGWTAPSKESINDPLYFVRDKNRQAGTTWDMYGIKASESLNTGASSIGQRFAFRGTPSLLDNKWGKQAPTIKMLEAYYRILMILTGDLNSSILGPFNDKSQDDARIINEFLLGSTATAHRGIFVGGDGFAEAVDGTKAGYVLPLLGVALRDASYLRLSGNTHQCIDLVTTSAITTNGDLYGVRNICTFTLDVLALDGPDAAVATYYDPVGANPILAPYISGVFKDAIAPNYWQALTDGWNVFNLRSRACDKTYGRLAYFWNVFTNIFGKICSVAGTGPQTTETPNNPEGRSFVDFAGIGNNPLRQGEARINLTLAKADRVEVKIYDVSGRLVRTLADGQMFQAGPRTLTWDGLDNAGRQVARGVYFTHVKFQNSKFENSRKMMVLK